MRLAAALAVLALLGAPGAQAQARGIQVAPIMLSLPPQRAIGSLRLSNGRERAVSFEADAYAWTQENGRDVLTPSPDILIAPGVFEVAAGSAQTIRIGVVGGAIDAGERAYRIILRELPRRTAQGAVLGFTLELSLPIFVTAPGARPALQARVDESAAAPVLRLVNLGGAHVQIAALESMDGTRLDAPRYVLAGAVAAIPLPVRAGAIRLATLDGAGAPAERWIDAPSQAVSASVR